MATKNLARTVIEGGRTGFNQNERNYSHRSERARTRAYLDRGRADPWIFDNGSPEPRPIVPKRFDDKLAPGRRWLRSQIGCPWDEVRARMVATFDTRTLAGRHIVYDHMLQDVVDCFDETHRWRSWFVVDAQGILR